MAQEEKSKYHLVLLPLPYTKKTEECAKELAQLQHEYLQLDNIFKLRDDLPLVKELMTNRFKELNQRMCEINSKEKYGKA